MVYRKIPNISPGLIEVRKPFLKGLYSGGLIFGGEFVLVVREAYIRGAYIRGAYIRDFTVWLKWYRVLCLW